MSGADRFERMLRWYPPSWRDRYGAEMTALLEDTHGDGTVPWGERIALAKAGSLERAREAGLCGDISGPDERIRGGAYLVLCAWALFMVGGAIFAKFSEQWSGVTPKPDQVLPGAGYAAVQWAGIAGGALVLAAALITLPACIGHIRRGGWASIRRPIQLAGIVAAGAMVLTVVVLLWAHHLGPQARNRTVGPYVGVGFVWAVSIVTAIGTSTAAAVTVTRRLDLSSQSTRVLGGMALALTALMGIVTVGTLVWWVSLAMDAPAFLGNGPLSVSGVVPPPMVIAGILMVMGLAFAAFGTARLAGPLRRNRRH